MLLITLAGVGGAQTYVISLLPAIADRFDVVVAAHGEGPLRAAAAQANVRYLPLRHVRRPLSPWHDLLGLVELFRVMRSERPHVLHANSSKAGVLGRLTAFLTRIPIRIFTTHGWAFAAHTGPVSALYRLVDRAMSLLTTVVICPADRERVLGLKAGTCRPDRTVVIHNAIDVAQFRVSAHSAEVPRIVSVGRLHYPKDFFTLVRALAHLAPEPYFVLIVGDGPDRPALARELGRLDLEDNVRITGYRDDVPDLLASADIFVLCTVSEAMPMSVLEAMAAGLPVVASSVGGIPELVVDGETGTLVAPGDERALATALRSLAGDTPLRRRMGQAGRARAEALFDLPRFHTAHIDLYRRELARRGLPLPNASLS